MNRIMYAEFQDRWHFADHTSEIHKYQVRRNEVATIQDLLRCAEANDVEAIYVRDLKKHQIQFLGYTKMHRPIFIDGDLVSSRIGKMQIRDFHFSGGNALAFQNCYYQLKQLSEWNDGIPISIGSTAWRHWNQHYKPANFGAVETDSEFHEFGKNFYFGGRRQCYQRGVFDNVVTLDIVSAYPHAMQFFQAFGDSVRPIAIKPKDIFNLPSNHLIEFAGFGHGYFPHRKENEVTYPHTDKTFFLTANELRIIAHTFDLGLDEIEVLNVYRLTKQIKFDKYVDYFFKLKNDSKAQRYERETAKLMLNALYGNFGRDNTKRYEWLFVPRRMTTRFNKKDWLLHRTLPVGEIYTKELKGGRFRNVITASSITGTARAHLLCAMKALSKHAEIIAVDTDSVTLQPHCDLETFVVKMQNSHDFKIARQSSKTLGALQIERVYDKYYSIDRNTYAGILVSSNDEWYYRSPFFPIDESDAQKLAKGKAIQYEHSTDEFFQDGKYAPLDLQRIPVL